MDNTEAKSFAAELGAEMPELDLHENYPNEIEDSLRGFILNQYGLGSEMVRVIYGGGKGVMKATVLRILEEPAIKEVIEKIDDKIGSCVVIFKDL